MTGDTDVNYVKLAQKFSWSDHYVIPFVMNMEVDAGFIEQVLYYIFKVVFIYSN